jgi:hypothetical protein
MLSHPKQVGELIIRAAETGGTKQAVTHLTPAGGVGSPASRFDERRESTAVEQSADRAG